MSAESLIYEEKIAVSLESHANQDPMVNFNVLCFMYKSKTKQLNLTRVDFAVSEEIYILQADDQSSEPTESLSG